MDVGVTSFVDDLFQITFFLLCSISWVKLCVRGYLTLFTIGLIHLEVGNDYVMGMIIMKTNDEKTNLRLNPNAKHSNQNKIIRG